MNPFLTRAGDTWILPVSALSLVLGFMLMLAWLPQSNLGSRIGSMDPDQASRVQYGKFELNIVEQNKFLTEEVGKLQRDKTRLENAIGDQTNQANVLNEGLQEAKLFAGLTPVHGPGVIVTLKDSDKESPALSRREVDLLVHDTDVLRVVNELRASGAEAIAVNGKRIVGKTSIRCVGPTILIDNVQIASPVEIRAIGNPDTLYGGLNLRGGVLDELRETGDPSMVEMRKVEMLDLPAYEGTTIFKYGKPTEESK